MARSDMAARDFGIARDALERKAAAFWGPNDSDILFSSLQFAKVANASRREGVAGGATTNERERTKDPSKKRSPNGRRTLQSALLKT